MKLLKRVGSERLIPSCGGYLSFERLFSLLGKSVETCSETTSPLFGFNVWQRLSFLLAENSACTRYCTVCRFWAILPVGAIRLRTHVFSVPFVLDCPPLKLISVLVYWLGKSK
jgi:hypothetical protein